MKRLITFGLIIGMLFTVVAGCSGKDNENAADNSNPGSSNSSQPVKITFMTLESDTQWGVKDTPNFKKIQEVLLEKFNVNYELEPILSKEYATTITTRFASGEKLPDMINHRFGSEKLLEVYQNKLILKLNDLVDKNAPDVKKLFEMRPNLIVANGDRDGNILRIPAQYIENPQHKITVMHIRNDWVQEIGMKSIQTTDDLYKALKAFQEKDINKSGKPDEVLTGIGASGFNITLGSAFGVKNMTTAIDSWYFDSANKVYNTFTTPEAKEYVKYMNKLYSEKLLDQNYVNQTGEQYNEKLYNNKIAAKPGAWWDSVLMSMAVTDKGFKCEHIPLMPPITANGKPTVYIKDLPGYGGIMITKDCKSPDLAMKIINWGYTLEGTIQNYYGETTPQGGDYYKKATALPGITLPNYQMEYTEKGKKAQDAEPLLWQKMGWNWESTTKLLLGNADAVAQEFYQAFGTEKCGKAAEIQFNMNGLNDAEKKYGIPAINFVSPTAEQSKKWESYSDLWIYMDEQINKFISGAESITKWDEFVKNCEKMGLKEATSIKQEQYDTYRKVMEKSKK